MELQVLGRGQISIERRVLEDQADVAADVVTLADDVVTGYAGPAAGWLDQRAEHVDRRALAGAVRPEEAEHLGGADFEADAFDSLEVVKPLPEVLDLNGVWVRFGHLTAA